MVDDYHQRQIQHGIWDFVHMGLKQDKHGVNHETWGLERRSRQTKTKLESLDWLKGKSTGNHGFLPLNIGGSCTFSHHPIL